MFHAAIVAEAPKILEQEKPFELPLENDVILAGRMDQVNSLGRNQVEIVDYKTGKPRKESEIRKSLQSSIYALAAKEIFERDPAAWAFYFLQDNSTVVTTWTLSKLPTPKKSFRRPPRTFAPSISRRSRVRLPHMRLRLDLPGPRGVADGLVRLSHEAGNKKGASTGSKRRHPKFVGADYFIIFFGAFFAGFWTFSPFSVPTHHRGLREERVSRAPSA